MGVAFLAINQKVDNNIISPTERLCTSKNMVEWGDRNSYPNYLLELFDNVPTLRSIISGNVDYICGDDMSIAPLQSFPLNVVNSRGDLINDVVRDIASDYEKYGGFALQIIRNLIGEVAEVYYIDLRFLRTNKDCSVFYYNEKWAKSPQASSNVIVYPAFMPDLNWASLDDKAKELHSSSILFVKDTHTQVYPSPKYAASIKACEVERKIDTFHLANINNSFSPSVLLNFLNGQPTDEVKDEIEKMVYEKWGGAENGGRIMINFADNKDAATTVTPIRTDDFSSKYEALAKRTREQIFTAFRAIPLLFGLTSEANTGFSTDEFEQSFKLYNRTQIRPTQRKICDAFDKVWGAKGVLTIKPFSIGGETETNVM